MNWLFKEEPTHYSYENLVRDEKTSWTGVRTRSRRNTCARSKRAIGFSTTTPGTRRRSSRSQATGDAYPDPKDPAGKLHAVDVVPVRKLARPVTLAEIKTSGDFRDFPLVRISRLSVMPVSDKEWAAIEKLASR